MLDKEQIEGILPHRDPFLMMDRVIDLTPGEGAVAERVLTGEEDVFRGHFPGHPVFPGVLQLEALAQTGAVAVLSQPENRGKLVLFGGIEKARFRARWCRATRLRLEVKLLQARHASRQGRSEGLRRRRAGLQRRAHLRGRRCALSRGRLFLDVVPRAGWHSMRPR